MLIRSGVAERGELMMVQKDQSIKDKQKLLKSIYPDVREENLRLVGRRVAIKSGLESAGRIGQVLAVVHHEQDWAVVVWDDEDDPDTHKASGLDVLPIKTHFAGFPVAIKDERAARLFAHIEKRAIEDGTPEAIGAIQYIKEFERMDSKTTDDDPKDDTRTNSE